MIRNILGAFADEAEMEAACGCSACDSGCSNQSDTYKAGYSTGYKDQKTA